MFGSENQALQSPKHHTIALDPGVRTFLTGYDADGKIVEWGTKDMSRIYRLCKAVDDLQSRWSQITHRKRYKIKRAARRIRLKIKFSRRVT
jgi:putative transposase